ncbi:hypothetical protein YPPY101_4310, partial [Yersinia pestis PY-101]|jgi:hypothetical protein
MISA